MEMSEKVGEKEANPKEGTKCKHVECFSPPPTVRLSSTDFTFDAENYLFRTIICKIHGERPSHQALQCLAKLCWDCDLFVGLIPKNFFFVVFSESEDRNRVLEKNRSWFFGKRGVFMRPWTPDFNPLTEVVEGFPVWINLYALPFEFWDEKALPKIGNAIGSYLFLDDQTLANVLSPTDRSNARMAVWMKASGPCPQSINISTKWREWLQTIEYENFSVKKSCPNTSSDSLSGFDKSLRMETPSRKYRDQPSVKSKARSSIRSKEAEEEEKMATKSPSAIHSGKH